MSKKRGASSDFEKSKRTFTVEMYMEEYLQLCSWVLKHERIETGGDLFGLWADDRTAVIQLAVGPGKKCTRTPVSFYQDVDYLKELGSYLIGREGLCHIGEWHSHHQLGLARPSGGDENTVWNNMPKYGMDRFVIFIANLSNSFQTLDANVGCFLFERNKNTGQRLPVLEGQFIFKEKRSPLRLKMAQSCHYFTENCESLNSRAALEGLEIRRDGYGRYVISKELVFDRHWQHGSKEGKDNRKKGSKLSQHGPEQSALKPNHDFTEEKKSHPARSTKPHTSTNRQTTLDQPATAKNQTTKKTRKDTTDTDIKASGKETKQEKKSAANQNVGQKKTSTKKGSSEKCSSTGKHGKK